MLGSFSVEHQSALRLGMRLHPDYIQCHQKPRPLLLRGSGLQPDYTSKYGVHSVSFSTNIKYLMGIQLYTCKNI